MKNKKTITLFFIILLLAGFFGFRKIYADDNCADHIIISEIYGGGGNKDAPYTNDFIELYNPTDADVDLTDWSVQYASATSENKNFSVTKLVTELDKKFIKAKTHYMIQEKAETSITEEMLSLPTPNATGNIAMSATAGKVALINNTEPISNKEDENVIDFVGYGGKVNEYEGIGPAPAPSNTKSIARNNVCIDTDDNSVDFEIQETPTPKNSASNEDSEEETDPPSPPEEPPTEDVTPVCVDKIILSEIYPFDGEFVEVENIGEKLCDLAGWKISDEKNSSHEFPAESITYPGEKFAFEKDFGLNGTSSDAAQLFNPTSATPIEIVKYEKPQKNSSYSKDASENWQWTCKPTRGAENDFTDCEEEDTPPADLISSDISACSDSICLNEILPNPKGDEAKGEYIEIFNSGDTEVDISSWILKDKSSTKYIFPDNTKIEPKKYLAIYRKDFKFALNNSGAESLTLLDPTEREVSKITYSGSKKDLSYNFDGASWRWSKFLTPGEENIFNNLPTVSSKKTNKIYVNVYADFSAEGNDADNDTLKYTWDFGDGHKSYKAETRHKYTELGKYTATLKVSDGSEDVITSFDIEVIEFPKLKIKITALSPNPEGKDTGSEYITLKNETKKKINLKGWSIATGWKDLINHPIREDFKIKAGKSKNLTNEFASIALNNTKSKIELRDPSGRVIDKVKYEKKDGIPDDAVYEKLKKKWQWNEKQVSPATEEIEDAEPEVIFPEVLENTENTNTESDIPDEEIQANLGKSSINPTWQKKKENKILLASADSHLKITLPEPQGQVLGASIIHATENYYLFTSPTAPEKHWAVKILDKFIITANSSINKLLFFN